VTPPLASDRPQTLQAATIGGAWLAVARRILANGVASRYDKRPIREISLVTLVVDRPDPVTGGAGVVWSLIAIAAITLVFAPLTLHLYSRQG
jgi:hypothetical protein